MTAEAGGAFASRSGKVRECAMQVPNWVSMRANLVLLAIAVAVADAAWLLVAAIFGKPEVIGTPAARIVTTGSAVVIALIVKRTARRAFDAAESSRHLTWKACASEPLIADECRHDWLVQLHLELNDGVHAKG
jgi:hypothetical protein